MQEEVKGPPPKANKKAKEEALGVATNNFDLDINSPEARAAIKLDDLLKDAGKGELTRLKKNALKRLHRKAFAKVPAKTEIEN